MDDVSAVIEFARRMREQKPEGRVVVHCLHGVSRSAGIALTLIADDLGSGRKEEPVQRLLAQAVEGRMHPNPLITGHWERSRKARFRRRIPE
ncbi:protein-tyrosine phosphatase family protein [Azospirillum griseum]|nr:protein-tyrosine phosphatase family protein [Azospirillum griseum]